MSLPPESLPDPIESTPPTVPSHEELPRRCIAWNSIPLCRSEPRLPSPFPHGRCWDVAAIVVFSIAIIIVFTLIALFVARAFPQYRNATFTDLATDARVVIGAQAAAYPIILLFIFLLVRSRSNETVPASDSVELAGSDGACIHRFRHHAGAGG